MSANIVKPINELDLDHPEENQIYEEVGPLLSRIHKQNRQIQTQEKAFILLTGMRISAR